MKCAWMNDETACGDDAIAYRNLPLCEEHVEALRRRKRSDLASLARQSVRHHPLESFPGFCYFALLPDGMIKIGYSNTAALVDNRMRSLGREYGAPVVLLACVPGGFTAEAVMHDKFQDDQVPGLGERFYPSAELTQFIDDLRQEPRTVPVHDHNGVQIISRLVTQEPGLSENGLRQVLRRSESWGWDRFKGAMTDALIAGAVHVHPGPNRAKLYHSGSSCAVCPP